MLTANQYVELRDGGYCITGTRIGLDVLAYEFRRGRTREDILSAYPSLGSLVRVYGALTFLLENPAAVEAYLGEQRRIFREIQNQRPMPQDMLDRFELASDAASGQLSGSRVSVAGE